LLIVSGLASSLQTNAPDQQEPSESDSPRMHKLKIARRRGGHAPRNGTLRAGRGGGSVSTRDL
jgi:hypothetical protein